MVKPVLACLLLLLTLAACTDGERMRRQLHALEARNQADSLLTDERLATTLCRYFDSHGTPNERMLAHYLLGRTYADLGEAPHALDEYHTAADCADTTAKDCDYRQLCRIYSQMADVFYHQNLITDYLSSLNQSIHYAVSAKDTLAELNSMAHKIVGYTKLKDNKTAIDTFRFVYRRYCQLGYSQFAARYIPLILRTLLDEGQLEETKHFIEIYEKESGYFDASGQIEKGREVFYYHKGLFFLSTLQYDSAEYYFRKEIEEGLDFNNQNAASKGLALLYQKTDIPDSAAKYALYSYAMNDSAYVHMATKEVEQAQAMYKYSRNQRLAIENAEKARDANRKMTILIIIVLLLMAFVGWLIRYYRMKRTAQKFEYDLAVSERFVLKSELDNLKAKDYDSLVQQKEQEIKRLSQIISKSKYLQNHSEKALSDSRIFQLVQAKATRGESLSEEEWTEIDSVLSEVLPTFYQYISSYRSSLNLKEYQTCMLLRMHVQPTSISNMLTVNGSYVTKMSRQIMEKLFHESGTSKELMKRLLVIK